MDIQEIKNTIKELEAGETTFASCQKLASLYVVIDRLEKAEPIQEPDEVENELDDILPAYIKFRDIKKQYQLDEITEEKVLNQMMLVCMEIEEFIHTMYSGTDMAEERHIIVGTLTNLYQSYVENP